MTVQERRIKIIEELKALKNKPTEVEVSKKYGCCLRVAREYLKVSWN